MSTNLEISAVCHELSLYGLSPTVIPGGKHTRIKWQVNGHIRTFIAANTPSDRRGWLNARSTVRGMLRQDGLTPVQSPVREERIKIAHVGSPPSDDLLKAIRSLQEEMAALSDLMIEHISAPTPSVLVDVSINGQKQQKREPTPRREPTQAGETKPGSMCSKVLDVLAFDKIMYIPDLTKALEAERHRVGNALSELKLRGKVENPVRGGWKKCATC